jgi:shikimate kinase
MVRPRATNLVLVGMPGSGKSTVGVMLAKTRALGFVDTDVVIQTVEGRSLQSIVDADGYLVLRQIEESVLLDLSLRDHVIATGGSAVYSEAAMRHLRSDGVVIFLDVDLPTLQSRVRDSSTRGLAKRPDQTLEDLFKERGGLYVKYADLRVACGSLTQDEVCAKVVVALNHERRRSSPG